MAARSRKPRDAAVVDDKVLQAAARRPKADFPAEPQRESVMNGTRPKGARCGARSYRIREAAAASIAPRSPEVPILWCDVELGSPPSEVLQPTRRRFRAKPNYYLHDLPWRDPSQPTKSFQNMIPIPVTTYQEVRSKLAVGCKVQEGQSPLVTVSPMAVLQCDK